jgi:predicted transcriptional regulator
MNKNQARKEVALQKIMDLLSERGEMMKREIAPEIGLSPSCISHYVDILHGEGRIYISGYVVSKYASVKRYRIGDLPDAVDPGRGNEEKEEVRPAVVVNVRRDPLDVALFGEYRKAA